MVVLTGNQDRENALRAVQAARELQVSRPALHSLLDKHRVRAKDFR